MTDRSYLHLGGIRDLETFRRYLAEQSISIPCDQELLAGEASPLAQPLDCDDFTLGVALAPAVQSSYGAARLWRSAMRGAPIRGNSPSARTRSPICPDFVKSCSRSTAGQSAQSNT